MAEVTITRELLSRVETAELPGDSVNRLSGVFQGERAQYVDANKSLADAAEELTFAFSERLGRSLARRRVSDGQLRLSEVQEMLEEYLRKVPDLERLQKLDALITYLGRGQLNNLQQLRAYLKEFSGEISHQFVALAYARQQLAQKTDATAMLALIDQALLHMLDGQEQAVELGVRIGPLAHEAESQGVGSIQALRDTYRDAVQDYQGLASAWKDIHERFGVAGLEGVTGFMMKALSADLDSQGRWLDPVKLERVMSDMHKLRVLTGMWGGVNALYRVLVERDGCHGIRAF